MQQEVENAATTNVKAQLANPGFPKPSVRQKKSSGSVCQKFFRLTESSYRVGSITQPTSGLQNWKCAGRRLVEIGGRLPTATQLHQSFTRILAKHLAANKKVNFVFQQKSSTLPMMNPSPTEIVDLFSFVEATLIQYATVAGYFPGVSASSVKP